MKGGNQGDSETNLEFIGDRLTLVSHVLRSLVNQEIGTPINWAVGLSSLKIHLG
jgi:hypothetical protein